MKISKRDFCLVYKDLKSFTKICEENNISYANVINDKASKEVIDKLYEKIKTELLKIYSILKVRESEENEESNSL